jgi:hypothetical protein
MSPLPCHICKRHPYVSEPKWALDAQFVEVWCVECHDGATDSPAPVVGFGWSEELAIEDWDIMTTDAAEEAQHG